MNTKLFKYFWPVGVYSDYDSEVRRLDDGLQITGIVKVKTRINAGIRTRHKTKYLNKLYSSIEYINYMQGRRKQF